MSVGAAIGLSSVLDAYHGEIWLMGTPSEETGHWKPFLIEQRYYEDIDVAMMVHPSGYVILEPTILAIKGYDFEFIGKKPMHMLAPHEGINALDAIILTF